MNRKRMQLSVFAAAALATTALPTSGGSDSLLPQPQSKTPTPRHAAPKPCPGEKGNTNDVAVSLVDSVHVALFDVYWNPVEKELTNTSCPPTVTHVPEQKGRGGHTARDDRFPSSIDIDKTIIPIPNSAKVTLNETDYPKTKYGDLWIADAKEDRDTDDNGTPDGVGDGIVWALPACPPEGTPASNDLCITFSAALLNPLDWTDLNEKDGFVVEYLLDHVHQTDIDRQDPRYTLAYERKLFHGIRPMHRSPKCRWRPEGTNAPGCSSPAAALTSSRCTSGATPTTLPNGPMV